MTKNKKDGFDKAIENLYAFVIWIWIIIGIILIARMVDNPKEDDWAEKTYPCIEHVKDWCYDIFQENNEFGVDTKKYNECKQDMVSTFCQDECVIRYGITEGYCDKPK